MKILKKHLIGKAEGHKSKRDRPEPIDRALSGIPHEYSEVF